MVVYLIKKEKYYCKRGDFNAWGFPGGAMEIGESVMETAIREIKEETGYDVEINELIECIQNIFNHIQMETRPSQL